MAKEKFYSVEVLAEKMQNGDIGWLEYVNHYSRRMKKEFAHWCSETGTVPSVFVDDPDKFLRYGG